MVSGEKDTGVVLDVVEGVVLGIVGGVIFKVVVEKEVVGVRMGIEFVEEGGVVVKLVDVGGVVVKIVGVGTSVEVFEVVDGIIDRISIISVVVIIAEFTTQIIIETIHLWIRWITFPSKEQAKYLLYNFVCNM